MQPQRPIAAHLSRWTNDPAFLGAWSYLPVGASPALRVDLGAPAGRNLFFAGEATDVDWAGMTAAAVLSGERAAAAALSEHGPGGAYVVIGAGFAGLTVANTLARAGASVEILEATDRVGGRARRAYAGTAGVEEGANWLHRMSSHPLTATVHSLGLTLVDTPMAEPLHVGPTGVQQLEYAPFLTQLQHALAAGSTGAREPIPMSRARCDDPDGPQTGQRPNSAARTEPW